MSFTQDELQAFDSILEQKLAVHRREMERSLDRRMNVLKRDFEQRLTTLQREMMQRLPQRIAEKQNLVAQPAHEAEMPREAASQGSEHVELLESAVERGLAAQLLAIEHLINQRLPAQGSDWPSSYLANVVADQSELGGIEIQTDLPWEELTALIERTLDARIANLNASMQEQVREMARYLSLELNNIREELARLQAPTYHGDATGMREVFASIQQLEHIIESMQVSMNANHALLSNRLYHHQQLPLERAHPGSSPAGPLAAPGEQANGTTRPLPVLKSHENDQQQS